MKDTTTQNFLAQNDNVICKPIRVCWLKNRLTNSKSTSHKLTQ